MESPEVLSPDELPPEKSQDYARVLVFTDTHFKAKNSKDSQLYADKLVEFAKDCGDIDATICLGDVLDGHRNIDMPSMNRAARLFKNLSEVAPLFVLVGNHDRISNTEFLTEESPFLALAGWPNLTLVDTSALAVNICDLRCLLVPYVFQGRFAEAVGDNDLSKIDVVFAHQEFRGVVNSAHLRSTEGDRWATSNPLVISGHYHDQQIVGPNIIYIGAAFQHAVNEDPHKGFSVFDFPITGELASYGEFVKEKYQWWFIEGIVEPTFEYYVKLDEIANFKPPSRGRVRLIIDLEDELKIAAVDGMKRVVELKQQGVKVIYRITQEHIAPIFSHRRTFAELLEKSVLADPELHRLLKEVL